MTIMIQYDIIRGIIIKGQGHNSLGAQIKHVLNIYHGKIEHSQMWNY